MQNRPLKCRAVFGCLDVVLIFLFFTLIILSLEADTPSCINDQSTLGDYFSRDVYKLLYKPRMKKRL